MKEHDRTPENGDDDSEASAQFSAEGSLAYYQVYGRFPWDPPEDAPAPTPQENIASPRNLLRLLLTFIEEDGSVVQEMESKEGIEKRILSAPKEVDLTQLSNTQLLNAAVAIAEFLFEAWSVQQQEFYQKNPGALFHWYRQLAHLLSKFRKNKAFLYTAESLIDRKMMQRFNDMGVKKEVMWYGAPHVKEENKKATVLLLKRSFANKRG